MGHLTLITGGARSGKSAFAESLALHAADATRPTGGVTYIATLLRPPYATAQFMKCITYKIHNRF